MKKPTFTDEQWETMSDWQKAQEIIRLARQYPLAERPTYEYLLDFISAQAHSLVELDRQAKVHGRWAFLAILVLLWVLICGGLAGWFLL